MLTVHTFATELAAALDVFTKSGGNEIESDFVLHADVIEEADDRSGLIGVEFDSGARFFISIEEV